MLKWLDAREATEIGTALADGFVLDNTAASGSARRKEQGSARAPAELQKFLQKFLQRVDREARPLRLNLFKRAKLANSFKWRLLEKGIEKQLVDELTQALVLRLTDNANSAAQPQAAAAAGTRKLGTRSAHALHQQGSDYLNQGAYTEALACYEELLRFDARDAFAHNGMGIALAKMNRYPEAEGHLRRAVGIRESFPEAQFNLAGVLQSIGRYREAEMPLRRTLKLMPSHLEARIKLAGTLVLTGRLPEARDAYGKALRAAPRNTVAIVGIGQIDALEGRFAEAESAYRHALEIDPGASYAWAALVRLRKMTPADNAWVKRAEEIAGSGLPVVEEVVLRFAIGKYYDDVGDFARAFSAYQRANELHKLSAAPYQPQAHARSVDELKRVYTREALTAARSAGSDSERPVLVVGMPRSGTSLVEQIIASHPSGYGAGELGFWATTANKRDAAGYAMPDEAARKRMARDYLGVLASHSAGASRVVDKAPINADYLGLIHSVFPKARLIYLQRDPIDTCLSCYFQEFSPLMDYTMDLADLANYYREHRRLMAHWREVLPQGTLLDVPYAELVTNQEQWTRRILEFLGLPWDERCLKFHETARAVSTASAWQVRQKIYTTSIERWRGYEKFIKPLLKLRDLDA